MAALPRNLSAAVIALAAISATALTALVRFDLGPPLAFVDDWQETWSVRQLVAGHGLHIFPTAAPTALPQIVLGAVLSVGHPDQRLLRLTVAPFLLLAAWSTFRLAHRAGAERWWAWMAALALAASPLVLAVSTTFMTDIVFLGLFMAALLAAARWVDSGQGIVLCIAMTVLATAQRQHGALIPIAVTAGLLAARHRRDVLRSEWIGAGGLWAATAVALGGPVLLGLTTVNQGGAGPNAFASVITTSPWIPVLAILYSIPVLGFFMLPLAGGIALGFRDTQKRVAWPVVVAGLAPLLVLFGLAEALAGQIFPGDFVDFFGLGPSTPFNLDGPKPELYGRAAFALLGILSLGSFVLLASRASSTSKASRFAPLTVLLVTAAAAEMIPVAGKGDLDRYFIPVVAPLIPLAGGLVSASRPSLAAQAWALAVSLIWVGMYAAGEQDYQAWQQARDIVARQAYVSTNPADVDAGYEADSVYWVLPEYDRTGALPDARSRSPRLLIMFARRGDHARGQDYSSLASGRVIIARTRGGVQPT